MERYDRLIFIPEKSVFGNLISYGAFYSLVTYNLNGVRIEEYLENDEFEEWGGIGYEQD